MFDDIWYHVFFYLTNDKDVFNVASVDNNFHQIIEKNLSMFNWFRFHKFIEKFDNVRHQSDKHIASYISPKMGAKFELQKIDTLVYLNITDYTGMKKQFLISNRFDLRTTKPFSEFLQSPQNPQNTQNAHQLFINGERVCFMIDFKDKTLDVLPRSDSLSNSYTYHTSILVDLHYYDYLHDDTNLIPTGESTFYFGKDFDIKILFLKKRHLFNVFCFKMMAFHGGIGIPCHYHCLPFKNNRLFVLQIENSIYIIKVSVPIIKNCIILCQLTDDLHSWQKYFLDYHPYSGTLKIVKDFGSHLKIVEEVKLKKLLH